MNYFIYIDESGKFMYNRKMDESYVGGWVCNHGHKALKKRLTKVVQSYLKERKLNFEFSIPEYLHFFPLHKPAKRKDHDSQINVPVEHVKPIVAQIFSEVRKTTITAFRSVGFPYFYANEQQAYMEILRATVYQLIDDLQITARDQIELVIAARRIKELIGEYAFVNIDEYEGQFAESLREEMINNVFSDLELKENNIQVVVSSARRNTCLAVADLFCGAFRWYSHDYLTDFKSLLKEYDIHNAFINIPNRLTIILENLFAEYPAIGLLRSFETLSKKPNQSELIKLINYFCQKVKPGDVQQFNHELRRYLQEKLVDDSNRYECLDQLIIFIREIEKRFTDVFITGTLKFYEVKILSHKGSTDLEPVNNYLEFLEQYGQQIYGNMYLVAHERIEAILNYVQPAAFNKLKFEKVSQYVSEEIEKYDRVFPDMDGKVDETRARLEGTIGQMFAFLSDYPGNEDLFQKAETYLKRDVKHCIQHSPFWDQGMGYLTSLYFRKKMLNETIETFMRETQSENESSQDIYNLSQLNKFKSLEGNFFLLHRLYVCALAQKMNQIQIQAPEILKDYMLQNEHLSKYPICQSAKWLSIIYAQQNDLQSALDILLKVNTGPTKDTIQGFTIDVIKLPIKILIHLYQIKLGIQSSFNLDNELDLLEKQEQGIKNNLISLGILKFQELSDDFDYFDVAHVLPFYYA